MDRLFQHTSGMRGNLFIVIKYRSVQIQSDHANLRFHMFCLLFSVATVLYPDCLLHSYFPFSPRTSHPHAPSPEYSISISQPHTAICWICAESQSSSVAIPSSPWKARWASCGLSFALSCKSSCKKYIGVAYRLLNSSFR